MDIRTLIAAAAAGGIATAAIGSTVTITVENTLPSGNFSFTPVWFGAHDGTFDSFDAGTMANAEITAIAEGGDTMPISSAFSAAQPGGVQTTFVSPAGAPPWGPGEMSSTALNVTDPATNRYLSFASMVVPSNDLFFANDNPTAYEMYNTSGEFNGPFEILIFGEDVWDNGTEVNDAFGGAAFSANGGEDADESRMIARFFTLDGAQDYLDSFVGTDTVDGETIGGTFGENSLIARITVVPAPGAVGGLAVMGLLGSRRRR